jgi:hypothetical protein
VLKTLTSVLLGAGAAVAAPSCSAASLPKLPSPRHTAASNHSLCPRQQEASASTSSPSLSNLTSAPQWPPPKPMHSAMQEWHSHLLMHAPRPLVSGCHGWAAQTRCYSPGYGSHCSATSSQHTPPAPDEDSASRITPYSGVPSFRTADCDTPADTALPTDRKSLSEGGYSRMGSSGIIVKFPALLQSSPITAMSAGDAVVSPSHNSVAVPACEHDHHCWRPGLLRPYRTATCPAVTASST